jgi:hypothetical protein
MLQNPNPLMYKTQQQHELGVEEKYATWWGTYG